MYHIWVMLNETFNYVYTWTDSFSTFSDFSSLSFFLSTFFFNVVEVNRRKIKILLSAICHVCCFNHCCLWAVDKHKIKFFPFFAYLFVFCNLTRHQQIYAKSLMFFYNPTYATMFHHSHSIVLYACCWLHLYIFLFFFLSISIFFSFILQLTLSVKKLYTEYPGLGLL